MEFGDASVEEAPPAPPRNKDLLKNMWMQTVAMLQGMENDGSLQRGLVSSSLMEEGSVHVHHRHN